MSDHDDLPLPGYDHLPRGSLVHRVRSLDGGEIRRILSYERDHAARPAIIEMLHARLAQLDSGAEPSGGDQRVQPESAPAPAGGSPVSTASAAESRQPLRHGVAGQTPHRNPR
jgi:hypothetical protein